MVWLAPPARKKWRTVSWPGADLGEGAVEVLVQVDPRAFWLGAEGDALMIGVSDHLIDGPRARTAKVRWIGACG